MSLYLFFSNCPQQGLITKLIVDTLRTDVAETNGFNNIRLRHVVKPTVLATLCLEMLENQWFKQYLRETTIPITMCLKPLVLQHSHT